MRKAKGIEPLFTRKDIDRWFEIFKEEAEDKMFTLLQAAGEMFVRYARLEGNYTDRTGNLRSSIGYVIVEEGSVTFESNFNKVRGQGENTALVRFTTKDGKAVRYATTGASGDGSEGQAKGRKLALELARSFRTGMVLIGVAGMEYAVYVEAMESKDVITAANIKTDAWMRKAIKTVFERA